MSETPIQRIDLQGWLKEWRPKFANCEINAMADLEKRIIAELRKAQEDMARLKREAYVAAAGEMCSYCKSGDTPTWRIVFGGLTHVWKTGNGHAKCSAEPIWRGLIDYLPQEDAAIKKAEQATSVEREKVATWLLAHGMSTGHGDTTEQLLDEIGLTLHQLEGAIQERDRLREALSALVKKYVANLGTEHEFICCITPKSSHFLSPKARARDKIWKLWDAARAALGTANETKESHPGATESEKKEDVTT